MATSVRPRHRNHHHHHHRRRLRHKPDQKPKGNQTNRQPDRMCIERVRQKERARER